MSWSVFSCHLLSPIVLLSMVNFFVSFYINSSNNKIRFNKIIKSNNIRQYIIDTEF